MGNLNTVAILAITLFILIKDALVPLVKLIKNRNNKKCQVANPISLDAFHQEFKDHKETQEKFNGEVKAELKEMDKRIDDLEKGRS